MARFERGLDIDQDGKPVPDATVAAATTEVDGRCAERIVDGDPFALARAKQ